MHGKASESHSICGARIHQLYLKKGYTLALTRELAALNRIGVHRYSCSTFGFI